METLVRRYCEPATASSKAKYVFWGTLAKIPDSDPTSNRGMLKQPRGAPAASVSPNRRGK